MKTCFVDTSAFIALIDKDDRYHPQAKEFYQDRLKPPFRLITTNFVICETVNFLRARLPLRYAVEFREDVLSSKIMSVIHITQEIEDRAFNLMKTHRDKTFSFTDCVSFVVMKDASINASFTFDDHFKQMGFIVVP